ncbi:cathepsin L-like [Manihot esculenta]|uniref:cathepsin L-like n=1 Tax=Manihot esculenta TaxID=3983 RepID=UPI001CC5D43B|nr:cathepsin L-like [Manihot esculenta]
MVLTEENKNSWLSLSTQMLINLLGDLTLTNFKSLHEVLVNDGLYMEEECPYIGKKPCHIRQEINEAQLEKIVTEGPIMGVIRISNIFAKLKKEDIYRGYETSEEGLLHFVVIVGFGVDKDDTKYWKFINSHGRNWGNEGHGRIIRVSGKSIFVYIWYPEGIELVD